MTDTLRAAAERALEALDRLPADLGRGSLNGFVAQAAYALRTALAEQPQPDYPCRSDGRCQYAIDSGAEGMGHCPRGKCVMPAEQPQPVAICASEIAKIIRHARAGNQAGVESYALLLCDKLDAANPELSRYLRRVIAGDDGERVYPAAPPAAAPSEDERRLRRWLCAARHGRSAYMDDGEASDCSAHPFIDYLRDSIDEIEAKWRQRAAAAARKA